MILLLLEAMVTASLAGALCGSLGVYLKRMNLLTISFTIAHAALAGAALSILLKTDPEVTAFIFGIFIAAMVEISHNKLGIDRELISMGFFSFSSAIAMFAIYLTPSVTLTSETASLVLWGSVLAATVRKIILLTFLIIALLIYVFAFKIEINTILFDKKLAEAEGVNVTLHATILIIITALSISLILKLTGAFLVFSLLFNPSMSAIKLTYKRQPLLGAIIGGTSGAVGVLLSFALDTPIGATISIVSSVLLMLSVFIAAVMELHAKRKIIPSKYL